MRLCRRLLVAEIAAVLTLGSGACTTGHEPSGCDPDLRISVDGGASIRFQWDRSCDGAIEGAMPQ